MAQILSFPQLPQPNSDVPLLDVNLPLILDRLGRLESKAEARRLFKVLTNALYALDVLDQGDWRKILHALDNDAQRMAP